MCEGQSHRLWRMIGLAVLAALACPSVARSQATQPAGDGVHSPPMGIPEKEAEPQLDATEPAPRPFTFGLNYYLMSDYVFRGVNFSEYAGEGREKLNHQVVTTLDVPLGKAGQFGTFGFDTFFEWYADQEKLPTAEGGANIQEIDYTLRYSYTVEPIRTRTTVGWTDYTFPKSVGLGENDSTHEWFVKFEHNDAYWWRPLGYQGDGGVLNPSFFLAKDMHASRGVWMEFGLSHAFEVLRNLTVTPRTTFAIDGGYLQPLFGIEDKDLRYAYTQFGLEVKYDLTELLHLPPWAGSVYIAGQLYYNLATDRLRREQILNDELFGGMALGWTW